MDRTACPSDRGTSPSLYKPGMTLSGHSRSPSEIPSNMLVPTVVDDEIEKLCPSVDGVFLAT